MIFFPRRCCPRLSVLTALLLRLAIAAIDPPPVEAQSGYPRIPQLSSLNPVFAQYSDDVLAARRALAAGKPAAEIPLHLYSYRVLSGDTLLTIAARCAVPYDAIATINRISSMQESLQGRILILPTLPALYLPETPRTALEKLLLSSFDPDYPTIINFTLLSPSDSAVQEVRMHCLPDLLFDGTVRAYFLNPSFRFPLPEGALSSSFGMRRNPVTGNLVFHHGIDIAAPAGTAVLACADGMVTVSGTDPVYGNYLIIAHEGGRESLYGHLRGKKVELHQWVKSGSIIGEVGSTGQSTGPHLHFEIHENGVPKNPAGFIKGN